MSALSVRSHLWCSVGTFVLLLLVFLQMITSLVYFRGIFILSDDVIISPLLFCLPSERGQASCSWWDGGSYTGGDPQININFFAPLLLVCFYAPVVLVAFALLAMLLATYAKDIKALKFSVMCQAMSSLLTLAAIVSFLLLHLSYLSWKDMTPWFYMCIFVQIELVITTVLTIGSAKRLRSGRE